MSLLQIRRNFQITLPSKLRHALGLNEGDLIDAELLDNQAIILKPKENSNKGRDFTADTINAWIKEDSLDKNTLLKATNLSKINRTGTSLINWAKEF